MPLLENISQEVRERRLTYLSEQKFDSLYQCLNAVHDDQVKGDFLEFGVALGGSGVCLPGSQR
jgi:asparagine synthase (glutamine-hydrolysing)